MAGSPIPAPQGPQQPPSNPGPGGGFVSPAPAQSDPRSAELLRVMLGVVQTLRVVASQVPAAASEVQQANDLVAKIIGKIKGGGPPAESQAPPV